MNCNRGLLTIVTPDDRYLTCAGFVAHYNRPAPRDLHISRERNECQTSLNQDRKPCSQGCSKPSMQTTIFHRITSRPSTGTSSPIESVAQTGSGLRSQSLPFMFSPTQNLCVMMNISRSQYTALGGEHTVEVLNADNAQIQRSDLSLMGIDQQYPQQIASRDKLIRPALTFGGRNRRQWSERHSGRTWNLPAQIALAIRKINLVAVKQPDGTPESGFCFHQNGRCGLQVRVVWA
jgi:hypothetical protein